MKITAKVAPWSPLLGGGLFLYGDDDKVIAMMPFVCEGPHLQRQGVQEDLAKLIVDFINRSQIATRGLV